MLTCVYKINFKIKLNIPIKKINKKSLNKFKKLVQIFKT